MKTIEKILNKGLNLGIFNKIKYEKTQSFRRCQLKTD